MEVVMEAQCPALPLLPTCFCGRYCGGWKLEQIYAFAYEVTLGTFQNMRVVLATSDLLLLRRYHNHRFG